MSNPLIRDCENYVVLEPCKKEKFLTRSEELNCSEQELEKAACLAYQGLSQKARGDITREYLRPYFEACS